MLSIVLFLVNKGFSRRGMEKEFVSVVGDLRSTKGLT